MSFSPTKSLKSGRYSGGRFKCGRFRCDRSFWGTRKTAVKVPLLVISPSSGTSHEGRFSAARKN
eukprot:182041-Prorocentrum_minimum.AAC.1